MISPARQSAFSILLKVEGGGYASDLLRLQTEGMSSRDAGLASEIVFGVLRFQAQLDFLMEHHAGRERRLDAEVLVALRMGIYQFRYLERIPPHAAVGESVELIKRGPKRSAAPFVNAILRKAAKEAQAQAPPWPNRAVELSCPE